MKICIVSDSHDHRAPLAAAVAEAKALGAQAVLHCGDLVAPSTLHAIIGLGAADTPDSRQQHGRSAYTRIRDPTGSPLRIELASRLGFPAFTHTDGARKFRDYPDFITHSAADGDVSLMGCAKCVAAPDTHT